MNSLTYKDGFDQSWIQQLMDLHNKTELKRTDSEKVQKSFESSFAVVTAWKGPEMIGCGRMISDGNMYSAIFDLVVDPINQRQGVGKEILKRLISKAPDTFIHLTSTFGKEDFYRKLGFKMHKTAMALYPEKLKDSSYLEP